MGERPGRSALPVFGSRSDPARLLALHFHFILIIQLYNNSCEFVAMNARSRSSIRVPSFSIINFVLRFVSSSCRGATACSHSCCCPYIIICFYDKYGLSIRVPYCLRMEMFYQRNGTR